MAIYRYIVASDDPRDRLDRFLFSRPLGLSRSYLQKIIREGLALVNGKSSKSNRALKEGDHVKIEVPEAVPLELKQSAIPLNILKETKDYIVVDKPPGMAVHPGVHGAHMEDSLVNALLHHCKGKLSGINGVLRPGIVHRLDKDTSGLLVVAKNDKAHKSLALQFSGRKVEKVYLAVLVGNIEPLRGTIDSPIGRDPKDRKKMAVSGSGREAITTYQVLEEFPGYSYVKVMIKTGRTHQIRVHFASIGFPILGDSVYGKPSVNKKFEQDYGLTRQFLHAGMLAFEDPTAKKRVEFLSPLPADLQKILDHLKA